MNNDELSQDDVYIMPETLFCSACMRIFKQGDRMFDIDEILRQVLQAHRDMRSTCGIPYGDLTPMGLELVRTFVMGEFHFYADQLEKLNRLAVPRNINSQEQ